METTVSWLLFAVTLFIHAATFLVLQGAAHHFSRAVVSSVEPSADLFGASAENVADTDILKARLAPPPSAMAARAYRPLPQADMEENYTCGGVDALHNKLDVRIFQ